MKGADKMVNKNNNIEEMERLNLHINKKYYDLLSECSKNNNRFTKNNITKSKLVEVALARFFAPLDKNLNLNAEPLEMIRDTNTETSIQELEITSAQFRRLNKGLNLKPSNVINNIEEAKKERENALNTHIVDLRISFKNENIKKTYAYYLTYDPTTTDKEVYVPSSNQGIFELLCLVSNIADNEEVIKCKLDDLNALEGLKVYCLLSKKNNANGELLIKVYPLALSD